MVESRLSYEQMRKRRMEENRKRMEELNLKNLSKALKNSPMKQGKPRTPRKQVDLASVRRSSRVADKPKPNYKYNLDEVLALGRPRRGYSRRNLLNGVYASDEERAYAIDRAEQLQSTLEFDEPSFVKPMLKSHVTGGFWLGLPQQFCKKHLPDKDTIMILVDEEGEEFEAKYLAEKTGLSGGWRGFSIDHNLVDGDALVFHLISPREFKVYIIRLCESEDTKESKDEKEEEKDPEVQVLDSRPKRTRARK